MPSSRRGVFAVLLAFTTVLPVVAQTPPADPPAEAAPAPPTPPTEPAAPAQPSGPSRVHVGVRFGPSFTTLSSVATLDATAAPAAFEPTLNFGGFVSIDLGGALSFQPEILFAAKGHRIRDVLAAPITTVTGELKLPPADRVILVRYLELPMLLRLAKQTHENTSLYVVAGPALALRRKAVIREVADSGRQEDIADLVSGSDLSYIGGAGIQHRRWMADARFTRGIRNIATGPAPAAVKTGAFSVLMGVRF